MKNITVTVFVLLIMAAFFAAIGAPSSLWFENANRFYENEQYDSAAVYYSKVISSGVENSAAYYNLGNTMYRLKKKGLALLNYEKAAKLSPDDPDIINNIKFVNLNIVDRVPVIERTFFSAIIYKLHMMASLNTQLWIIFGFLLTLSIFFALYLFVSRNIRLWLIYLSSLLIICTTALGISAGIKIHAEEKLKYAIVLESAVDAKNRPKGDKILFTVHEGTKLQIRKTMDGWSLVNLPNGIAGWIENNSFGII